ncbi:MAG: hypothetical protein HC916_11190 [Coleofasciculaceae cyanobacterium SM2_1_6]|nr:hypothetical protein [Coleofasciculaceae cyanobacterium SM2_1_6]
MTWRGEKTIQDRMFACVPYSLPLASVLSYGVSLMQQFPPLRFLFQPLFPILFIYSQVPFGLGESVVFLLLFLFVVRNARVPHFIRFNTMQALLLQLAIFLCDILLQILMPALGQNLVTETLSNIIFLSTVVACFYSIVQSILGRYAELPSISEAVYTHVR